MSERIENLNKHLLTLVSLNENGIYQDEIIKILSEINVELGIGGNIALQGYSTRELREELVKRGDVEGITIASDQEVVIEHFIGEIGKKYSYSGPAQILINKDGSIDINGMDK